MNAQELMIEGLKEYKHPRESGPWIYVACLAAYNNGYLHGRWINAAQDREIVWDEINEMLKDSPVTKLYGEIAEEWAIHDFQGFGEYRVEEWNNIDEICEVAQVLDQENGELIVSLVDHLGKGTSIEDAKQFLEDNYAGCHKDLEDFAYSFFDECYGMDSIPKQLVHYVDYAAMGRDMAYGGDIFTISNADGMHVFWNR